MDTETFEKKDASLFKLESSNSAQNVLCVRCEVLGRVGRLRPWSENI